MLSVSPQTIRGLSHSNRSWVETMTAVAHLHKGQALIATKQTEAGVHEFRMLIQRFPNSAEAGLARSRLNGMGVSVASKPPA